MVTRIRADLGGAIREGNQSTRFREQQHAKGEAGSMRMMGINRRLEQSYRQVGHSVMQVASSLAMLGAAADSPRLEDIDSQGRHAPGRFWPRQWCNARSVFDRPHDGYSAAQGRRDGKTRRYCSDVMGLPMGGTPGMVASLGVLTAVSAGFGLQSLREAMGGRKFGNVTDDPMYHNGLNDRMAGYMPSMFRGYADVSVKRAKRHTPSAPMRAGVAGNRNRANAASSWTPNPRCGKRSATSPISSGESATSPRAALPAIARGVWVSLPSCTAGISSG